jgi:predicted ATPase/DNA-binding SARP family transcriptional activator/tetratricopeptide (TPR) repeat protein
MDVRFLGGLQVRVGGRLTSFGGPQAQSVFALLAIDAGTTVTTSTLVDELWPLDPPRAAVNTVQTHVAAIRRGLGTDRGRLRTRGRGYELDLRPDELDTARSEVLVRRGHELLDRGDPSAACGSLEAALTLWGGEPLLGLTDHAPRLAIEASRLAELHLATLEDLTDTQLRIGATPTVLRELERATAADPFRERTVALLLRSLAAAGRRAEALARYEAFRRRLVEELGLDPSEALQRLHRELLGTATLRAGSDVVRPPSQEQERAGALPVFHTRWFGREHDLDRVAELLGTERLVTLVGPGGCGKTRTAIELAQRVGRERGCGTRFVDLAPIRAGELVERTTARALGVTFDPHARSVHEQIVRHVDGAPVLVVLDNCEHLVDEAATHVRALLDGCPTVTVLATSREPLAVDGERAWRLGGLELPDLGDALDAPAVGLLLDRGRAVRHDLTLDGTDADAAAATCRLLDGLPLAIELVASHLAHRSPAELAALLTEHDRNTLLRSSRRGPRHRTLETTIDWSYRLLDPPGRELLRELSVFVGGADLAAVTAVAGDGGDDVEVLQQLGSLVTRSLVNVTEVRGTTRYGLLETIREFAAHRLGDGEELTVRTAHRDHYLALIEKVPWDHRMFSEQVTERLEPELGNLRAAIEFSVAAGDRDVAARVAFGAPRLVIGGSYWDEYDRWLTRLWGTSPDGLTFAALLERASRPEHIAAASWMEGWRWARSVDEVAAAVPILRQATRELAPSDPARTFLEFMVAIGRWHVTPDATSGLDRMLEVADCAARQGAELLRAAALDNAGLFQLLAGRYDDAVRTLEPCAVPTVWEHDAKPLLTLGFAQHLAGAHDAAVRTMRTNVEVVTRPAARFLTLLALGLAVAGTGDLEEARELVSRAREEIDRPRWHHPQELVDVLVILGACAALEGRTERAAHLLTAAGHPTDGTFRPMTAIHLHYLAATGGHEILERQAIGADGVDPGSPTYVDPVVLVDEELVRWARPAPPLATSGPGGVPWTSSSG